MNDKTREFFDYIDDQFTHLDDVLKDERFLPDLYNSPMGEIMEFYRKKIQKTPSGTVRELTKHQIKHRFFTWENRGEKLEKIGIVPSVEFCQSLIAEKDNNFKKYKELSPQKFGDQFGVIRKMYDPTQNKEIIFVSPQTNEEKAEAAGCYTRYEAALVAEKILAEKIDFIQVTTIPEDIIDAVNKIRNGRVVLTLGINGEPPIIDQSNGRVVTSDDLTPLLDLFSERVQDHILLIKLDERTFKENPALRCVSFEYGKKENNIIGGACFFYKAFLGKTINIIINHLESDRTKLAHIFHEIAVHGFGFGHFHDNVFKEISVQNKIPGFSRYYTALQEFQDFFNGTYNCVRFASSQSLSCITKLYLKTAYGELPSHKYDVVYKFCPTRGTTHCIEERTMSNGREIIRLMGSLRGYRLHNNSTNSDLDFSKTPAFEVPIHHHPNGVTLKLKQTEKNIFASITCETYYTLEECAKDNGQNLICDDIPKYCRDNTVYTTLTFKSITDILGSPADDSSLFVDCKDKTIRGQQGMDVYEFESCQNVKILFEENEDFDVYKLKDSQITIQLSEHNTSLQFYVVNERDLAAFKTTEEKKTQDTLKKSYEGFYIQNYLDAKNKVNILDKREQEIPVKLQSNQKIPSGVQTLIEKGLNRPKVGQYAF